jgi:hypothetical protein
VKYFVTRFKSLPVALKELEPFIRNGKHLQTNWADGRQLTFSSDPTGGDGIIEDMATGETWHTEHVLVPHLRAAQTGDAETLILRKVEEKQRKGGAAYAAGKTLIVFLNAGAGIWHPNRSKGRFSLLL